MKITFSVGLILCFFYKNITGGRLKESNKAYFRLKSSTFANQKYPYGM